MKRLLSLTISILTFGILAFGAPRTSAATLTVGAGTLQFNAASYSFPENGGATIFPPGATPTQSNPNNLQLELGVKFRSDVSGFITGVRFYKGSTDTSTHSGTLWSSAGTLIATGTFTNETPTGWQQLNFDSAVAITANTTYIASYHTSSAFFYNFGYFQSQGADNVPLHALRDGVDGPNGVYRYGPGGVVPGDTFNSSNYWVDVAFSASPQITITRTGGSAGAVGVTFATSSGTATAGADYTAVSQLVSFADGDTASKTVSVPILDDLIVEGNETVNLALSSPTGGAALGSPSTAVLTIVDNESAPAGTLQFSTAAYSLAENGGSATITITRTGGSAGAVGASFATSDGSATAAGSDYTPVSQLISFADGDTVSKTVSVPILDDLAVEGNETVNLALNSPTGGATLGSPSAAVLTILDNESPSNGTLQFSSAAYSLAENGSSSVFALGTIPTQVGANNLALELGVKLRSDVSGFITGVRFFKGSTDTSVHTGSLWSSAGSLLANGTFTNETPTGWQQLNFDAPVAITAGTTYIASYHTSTAFFFSSGFFQNQGLDNVPLHALQNGVDGPNGLYHYGSGVVPSDSYFASNYYVDVAFSASINAMVTVTRTGGSAGAVGASFATSDGTALAGSDYTALSRTVSFANGDTASKTVVITILDDNLVEGNETINLALTSPTGGATLGSPNTAVLTIADNESPSAGALQFSSAAYSLAENGGSATITVTRTGGSAGAVGAHFATSDGTATAAGSDYTPVSGTVSFADGDTASKTVNVTILDDVLVEGNETVNLALSSPTGGATLGSPSAAVLTIIDNESPSAGTLQFSSAVYSLNENGSNSIFALGAAPTQSSPNSSDLELGVKLRSDASGFITGVRFYKGPTDVSVHTGSLWTSTGTLLASGTFANETATGWQQLNFDAPVAITANTTYIASYHTSSAFFYDAGFFQNQGADNAPLHALKNGVDGPNALYHYGSGVVPTDSYFASNYWVDVAFSASLNAMVTVTRTGGSAGAVGVTFATSNGTALAASDYTTVNRTVSFANGDNASKTVVIPILDDTLTEGTETVNLALSNATGGATLGSPNAAVLSILDNESGPVGSLQFSAATYSRAENGGSATITVTRTGGSTGAVGVSFATSDGTATVAGADYTAVNQIVSFANGDTADKTVNVPILDDSLFEGNETVNLALSSPTGGATLGSPSTAVLTILDNEVPGALQFSAATYSRNENGGSAAITITRTGGNSGAVGVSFATSDGTATTAGSDYTAVSQIVSFADGDAADKTVNVPILDDNAFEGPETVNLALSNPTGGATLGSPNTAVLTIIDNETPTTLQFSAATYSRNENGGSATITVTRAGASAGAVGVSFATSDGTATTAGADYTAVSQTVSFASGDTADKTVNIPILDDNAYEGNETVNLALSSPTGGASLGSPNTAVLTIVDDETPTTLQFSATAYSRLENGGSATITIKRTGASAGAVGVSVATSDGTATTAGADYTAVSQIVSFGDGDTADKTVTVPILDDSIYEGDETVNLALSNPTGSATLGSPSTAVLTILDNETPADVKLQFSAATYSRAENLTSATITITRTGGSKGAVGADFATSNGTATAGAGADYTALSQTVSFADGDAADKTVTVSILDDSIYEGDETVNLTLSSPTGGATLGALNPAVLTIVDNETPADVKLQFSAATYSLGETGGNAAITVTRTGGSKGPVAADFATSNGTATASSDYTAVSQTVSFADGDAANKTINVAILDDNFFEGPETVNLALSNPAGGATLGSPSAAVLTILDNETPTTLQFSAATYNVAEDGVNATITITRLGASGGAVGVDFATSAGTANPGSDYTEVSQTVSFADGDSAAKTVQIPIRDDTIFEGNITVNLALSNPTGNATLGSPNTAVLTIVDNDLPGVLQFSSPTYSLAENGSVSLYPPSLVPPTSFDNDAGGLELGVKLRSDVDGFITGIRFYKGPTDTGEHTGSLWSTTGSLIAVGTFTNETASGWQQLYFAQPVAILANTTYIVSYHTSTAFYATIGFFTNVGVDNAPLHALQDGVDGPNGVFKVSFGGDFPTDTFNASNYFVDVSFSTSISGFVTVTRTGGSTGVVGATFATSNGTATAGSDYTAVNQTVSFANGDTASKTVTLTIFDDGVLEPNETVNLTLSNPTGGATLGSQTTAVLTIIDNSTTIAGCPFTISSPGLYQLAANCSVSSGGTGIDINANNVHLFLNGHTITGPSLPCGDGSIGIHASGSSFDIVTNGSLTGLENGILFGDGHNNTMNNLTLTGNCNGMFLDDSSDNDVYDNNASQNTENGAIFDHASRNNFHTNTVKNNGGVGHGAGLTIDNAADNVIASNDFSQNGQYGVSITGVVGYSTGNKIHGNVAQSNGGIDLADFNATCVNTWTGNTFTSDNESGMDFGPGAGCIQ